MNRTPTQPQLSSAAPAAGLCLRTWADRAVLVGSRIVAAKLEFAGFALYNRETDPKTHPPS